MKQAQRELDDAGALTIKDRFGQVKPHPSIVVERDSRAALLSGCKELRVLVASNDEPLGPDPFDN